MACRPGQGRRADGPYFRHPGVPVRPEPDLLHHGERWPAADDFSDRAPEVSDALPRTVDSRPRGRHRGRSGPDRNPRRTCQHRHAIRLRCRVCGDPLSAQDPARPEAALPLSVGATGADWRDRLLPVPDDRIASRYLGATRYLAADRSCHLFRLRSIAQCANCASDLRASFSIGVITGTAVIGPDGRGCGGCLRLRSGLILVFDVLQRTPLLQPKSTETLSIATKSKNLQANADGSLTLYAGSKSPGKDKETNWLP